MVFSAVLIGVVRAVNEKQFFANTAERLQSELSGVREAADAFALGDGWRTASAKDFRAHGEVELIDESGAE